MSQVHPAEWLILLLAVLALMVLIALATAGIAIVIALRKERPGTALAIVGATLLGLMALPVAGWLLFVHRASADFGGIPSVVPMSPSGPIANGARLAARGWQFTEHDAIHAVTNWNWVTLLLIGFIFAAVVRRLMIPRTTRTRRRWSPAVLVVLLFAVVLGIIRHQTARSYPTAP
ncbi:MAG TPA: hypothetical protein VFW73_08480, partial [Lacipirellulaceae bacterium]|nr:hypothetical protein [Lacipirellulaceae bacterium]